MKGIDLSCTSPASTAICVSLDQQHSMVHHSLSRAIDRHNPHLRDPRRRLRTKSFLAPSSSSSSSSVSVPSSSTQASSSSQQPTTTKKAYHDKGKKKSKKNNTPKPSDKLLTTSPAESSRYLLSDSVFFDVVSESDPDSSLVPVDSSDSPPLKPSSSSSCSSQSTSSHDEVVVLRVSLHCKGCEGKVRKHISKMQGVKSFNIDFATKKVTVIGDVTPLGVLASVSRVKNAQFWPSPPLPSSSSPAVCLTSR